MSKSNISVGTKLRAERINAAWQSSVDGILKTCQLLVEAKEALGKGEFANMIANELVFQKSTASRLLTIGQDHRLVSHAKLLPPHWYTLYELTRLDDTEFERALDAKIISPDMERADVPKAPRNLGAGKRSRVIQGSATEIEREPALPGQPEAVAPLKAAGRHSLEASVPVVQPFGSGDNIVVTFPRNRPEVSFWQGLMIAIAEWTKMGSVISELPSDETQRTLSGYDMERFGDAVLDLNVRLRDARNDAA